MVQSQVLPGWISGWHEQHANDRISMSLANTSSTGLSIDTDSLASATGAQAAITALDTALATINTERATLGATSKPVADDYQQPW